MKTLCIGDTHFPFTNLKALELINSLVDKLKPDRIVQIGDLYDHYAYSRFPKSMHITPKEEINQGRLMATEMWGRIKKKRPSAECIQILGNHCARPLKRVEELIPQAEDLIAPSFKELYTFKGVATYLDPREVVIRDDIAFLHGSKTRLGDHALELGINVVVGHSHRGGVFYKRHFGRTVWELNCGFVGDADSKALSYTPTKISQWTLGVGWIDEMGPRFISF